MNETHNTQSPALQHPRQGNRWALVAGTTAAIALTGLLLAGYYFATIHLKLFEDGSFILTGCYPWALCSGIGIDTPWEDILPYPLDEITYYLVKLFLK